MICNDDVRTLKGQLGPAIRHGGFRMKGWWVWCGSVIQGEDGKYHMFASRWPDTIPFNPGWLTSSEVVRAVADRPEGPYVFQEVVLPARGAAYWDGRATHNPVITRCGDRYVLFYSGTTHPFEEVHPGDPLECSDPRCLVTRSNQRVGIATATSLSGPWTRQDEPILPTRPGTFYSFFTTNPAPCVAPDGSIVLMFKSRQYVGNGNGFSRMMFGVARADSWAGPYRVMTDEPIFCVRRDGEIEDPFIWLDGEEYQMLAKDVTGAICGEAGGGILARSHDAINWNLQPNEPAYSRSIVWDDGGRETLGSLERPFLLIAAGRPTHLFAAASDGPGGFIHARSSWNQVIPIHGAASNGAVIDGAAIDAVVASRPRRGQAGAMPPIIRAG